MKYLRSIELNKIRRNLILRDGIILLRLLLPSSKFSTKSSMESFVRIYVYARKNSSLMQLSPPSGAAQPFSKDFIICDLSPVQIEVVILKRFVKMFQVIVNSYLPNPAQLLF